RHWIPSPIQPMAPMPLTPPGNFWPTWTFPPLHHPSPILPMARKTSIPLQSFWLAYDFLPLHRPLGIRLQQRRCHHHAPVHTHPSTWTQFIPLRGLWCPPPRHRPCQRICCQKRRKYQCLSRRKRIWNPPLRCPTIFHLRPTTAFHLLLITLLP